MAKKALMNTAGQFILALLVGALAIWAYNRYTSQPAGIPNAGPLMTAAAAAGYQPDQMLPDAGDIDGYAPASGAMGAPSNTGAPTPGALEANLASEALRGSGCYPKAQLTAAELLPNDGETLWAEVNPTVPNAGGDGRFLYGISAVSQVLRNANMQLRSDPVIAQVIVSPFLNSTISPDTERRQFELGADSNC